ncbi:Serine/threonine-protein kinase HSL1 [Sphaceloma murrayae]|uniref:Serine/threonine-protein kinase HSL1 n=1 Tax=Sphaceloma murrayae TaxID=2082308 RepID=A0A2K1R071_9PEZI|nr:Serine/threonine-protein kinase HSL1 [Sphaceloma murrayae]
MFTTSSTPNASAPTTTSTFSSSLESFRAKQPTPASRPNELQRSRGRGEGVNAGLNMMQRRTKEREPTALKLQQEESRIQGAQDQADLERQMTRWWKEGDVYAPHDLSGAEMSKWKMPKSRGKQKRDVCDVLQLNPLEHYKVIPSRQSFWRGMS